MWILGNFGLDFLFLILPLIVALSLSFTLQLPAAIYALSLITFAIIDSGHIYITIWRTYGHPAELASNKKFYFIGPLAVLCLMALWIYSSLPYFWHFIIYATIFHNIRQFYGITKWYQKLAADKNPAPGYWLYALTITPCILYHFRSDAIVSLYTSHDIDIYPNPILFTYGSYLYLALFSAWIFYELYLYLKNKSLAVGRFLSVALPATGYGIGFLLGTSILQILSALIVSHGISYLALTALALKRTRKSFYKTLWLGLVICALTAIFMGLSESWVEDFLLYDYNNTLPSQLNIWLSLAVAAYLTPLIMHYIIDAKIWTHKHREAKMVFAHHD